MAKEEEMASLKADNEKILNEAKLQRDSLLKEAKKSEPIIADAESEANGKGKQAYRVCKNRD